MLVEIKSLTLATPQRKLIENFNYSFERRCNYFFFGRSGIGKSLLLDSIAGLYHNYTGEIIRNNELFHYKSYIFQKNSLIPWLTVKENLLLIENIDYEFSKKLLQEFDLQKLINRKATHLSGGEVQIVNFIRALSNTPKIIFADEPFASIDYRQKKLMSNLLVEYCQSKEVPIFWVSHDFEEICRYADEVLCFDGEIGAYSKTIKGQDVTSNNLFSFLTRGNFCLQPPK